MAHTALLHPSRRRALLGFGALCAAPTLLLTGCFSEPKERKAFIEFLDKEVLSARGMSYPVPNEGKRQTFGDYAKHYDVVVQFIEKMEALPLAKQIQDVGMTTSLAQLKARREQITAISNGIPQALQDIRTLVATADKAKAELKQPEDLKPVYDKVYAKYVTRHSELMLGILPALQNIFTASLELLALADQHPKEITTVGGMTQVSSQRLLNQVNAISAKMVKEVEALNKLESELRKL